MNDPRHRADLPNEDLRCSAAALIGRIGAEISRCAEGSTSLQNILGSHQAFMISAPSLALQRLDLIDQTLRNLADILDRLSGELRQDIEVDAQYVLRTCLLSAVKDRLSGDPEQQVLEDVEFF